ncbi:MAG: translation initiation factor IF-2 [Candidatus Magasanikbacteria bacterium RIFCSPHIGHO2_01_FULL_50_8]|uniref:Translation initiation factor IF-2 n=1 Tax=Candidatus Magasanikbacteria bacterium RIFCSPHIGHO2_01_FULL_50_8 TaxID=1798674 RepID=A0A1F6LS26_9BACT|nr:MAG: translation initiation factor IF-2 [Candidatus Magasanikbacteria bacterium RIFCSPHIGHO2_01_FULL_50_8]
MNVSELSRRLRVNIKELYEVLPNYGYDIGRRAVKVDDKIAESIIREWRRMYADWKDKQRRAKEQQRIAEKEARKAEGKTATLPAVVTVRDFAAALGLPVTTIISELMKNGILASLNERIDFETATVIAEDLGFAVQLEAGAAPEAELSTSQVTEMKQQLDSELQENLVARAPVIVVMGHVDHGKTKLLDTIRTTDVVASESGGITQHIGAYQVIKNNRPITFIDTPGHEAFTVMRSRGARIADIAILVVAADDGVMPQTVEAIKIIQAAKIPMVVALNKMDKEGVNIDKAKTELSNQNVLIEEWGGSIPLVPISAKSGMGVDKLLETLLLVADVEADKIRANPLRPAIGTIIESHVDKGEGPVATLLVQGGTLHKNDPLVVNSEIYGTVRAMKDHRGAFVEAAPPSTPVKILGFKYAPEVGDIFDVSKAAEATKVKKTRTSGIVAAPVTQQQAAEEGEETTDKKIWFNVFVKADVLGSLEAIIQTLEKYQTDEVGAKIIGKGLGNFTEADIQRAESSNAVILGFHVVPMPNVQILANNKHVEIHLFKVIYDLFHLVEQRLNDLVPAEIIVTEHGTFKTLAIFRTDKKAQVVGGRVDQGKIPNGSLARVYRNREYVADGKIVGTQLGKVDVKEIPAGHECGIKFEGKAPLEVGDVLEAYSREERKKKATFGT